MFIEFPLINDGKVAINTDRVTHVKQNYYAKHEKSIICFDSKSVEVDMGIDEVVERLNNADFAIMVKDDIQGGEQC